jgi:hypothetical protein
MSIQEKLQKLHSLHKSLLTLQEEVLTIREAKEKTRIMQQILRLQREYNETLEEARSYQQKSVR